METFLQIRKWRARREFYNVVKVKSSVQEPQADKNREEHDVESATRFHGAALNY